MLDALWAALPPSIVDVLPELWVALGETLVMMAVGLTAAVLIGGPLGIWLYCTLPNEPSVLAYRFQPSSSRYSTFKAGSAVL